MASITTLLATDSLASSRIVLNDNFSALNSELTDVTSLLDPNNETITLTGAGQFGTLSVVSGGSNRFVVNASDIVSSLPHTMEAELILEEALRHSIISGATSMPAANAYVATTYVLDATALTGTNVVAAGDAGQEITLIADGGSVTIDPANVAGATALEINDNGTLTLRFHNSLWYIISEVNCTVTF